MVMMKTIERRDLEVKLQKSPGRTLLIDVRDRDDYEKLHIKGAISIPLEELAMRAKAFDQDKEIILYCTNFQCDASTKAAKVLDNMGYTNVRDYKGGMADWREAGYETEGRVSARAA